MHASHPPAPKLVMCGESGRDATMLVYLFGVDAIGETAFPCPNMRVQPCTLASRKPRRRRTSKRRPTPSAA